MKLPPWSRIEKATLAKYATAEATRWLPLDVARFDLGATPEGRRKLVQAIYEALADKKIRYALEEYHPAEKLQPIRTPPAILEAPREGTCLDLALLFCGLCLGFELLPILIVVEGHALAAVCLTHGLRDWDGIRPGRSLMIDGPLTETGELQKLFADGSWIPVECTGFAFSTTLAATGPSAMPEQIGRVDGLLSFERAVAAGREQLSLAARPFSFAIDIAIAHNVWRIEPFPLELPSDVFQQFAQAPAPLARHIRTADFETLVAERTRAFVGREFIFKAIDDHLKDQAKFPSGYIVVIGEPGIGKTALLAQLVKLRGCVHYFNVAQSNRRSTEDFLRNVCAQLIVRYGLAHRVLPEEATANSAFLETLLAEAAAKAAPEPVMVVVDALDEADDARLPVDANHLYLPRSLPARVCFVVSSRPKVRYRLVVDRRDDIWIRDNDPRNESDVREYVHKFLLTYAREMVQTVKDWAGDEATFTQAVTDLSQGNFMYLVYVLPAIRDGHMTRHDVSDIRKLPRGLNAYYQWHWAKMKARDPDRFERYYEPVVCMLATVKEAVSIARVQQWLKLSPLRIKEVIDAWYEFLNEEPSPEGPLYRVYHASFQDFLREEVGLGRYHEIVVDTALAKIPGFSAEGLRDGS